MKTKLILSSILIVFFFAACEKDDDQDQPSNNLQADAGTIDGRGIIDPGRLCSDVETANQFDDLTMGNIFK